MGRGDRHKVRWAHDRKRKKNVCEKRKSRERASAGKSS